MLLTLGPWRVSDHDECEIYTADGNEFIGSIARPENALAIATLPKLVGFVLELAECPCACQGEGPCAACRAQRVMALFQISQED